MDVLLAKFFSQLTTVLDITTLKKNENFVKQTEKEKQNGSQICQCIQLSVVYISVKSNSYAKTSKCVICSHTKFFLYILQMLHE